jgi:DNA polymerase III subunit delta'
MFNSKNLSNTNQRQYQAQAFLELKYIIQTKKIPNAFLFSGNDNTRKNDAAFFFAKGCNCLNNHHINKDIVCNICISCRKIDSNNHPDILLVDLKEGKKIISISQIRELGLKIALRPNEAKFRMVLILNSDKMNDQAQNALLKMLEEPPEKTFFILIAKKTITLLPTIISRCRKIRFKPLSQNEVEQSLINNFNISSKMAYIAAKTSDSDLEKAMMYLNLDKCSTDDSQKSSRKSPIKIDWIQKREYLLKTLVEMIQSDTHRCVSKGLMLAQKISLDTDLLDDTINIMKTFFRDLIIFRYNQKQIINIDFSNAFKDINLMVKSNNFYNWLENLFEAQRRIASNSSIRLVLDRFFLKIAQQADTKC